MIALVRPTTENVAIPSDVGLVFDTTTSDDGFGGSTLTHTWSVISAAGAVIWDNQNQADTGATFAADGSYTVRLTVSDGSLSATQDFMIEVGASSSGPLPDPVSPALYYAFNDATGSTASDSAGSNSGTLTNGPVWGSGQRNGGLQFDGTDDYVISAAGLANDDTTGVSASAWINWDGDTSGNAGSWRNKTALVGRTFLSINTTGELFTFIGTIRPLPQH